MKVGIRVRRRGVEIGCVVLLAVLAAFTLGFFLGSGSNRAEVTVETAEVQPVRAEAMEGAPQEAESAADPQGRVNLNTATQEDLEKLPGIGQVLAQRILEYRAVCGPFVTAEQLMEVEGIGEKRFEALKEWITVEEPNENSGS